MTCNFWSLFKNTEEQCSSKEFEEQESSGNSFLMVFGTETLGGWGGGVNSGYSSSLLSNAMGTEAFGSVLPEMISDEAKILAAYIYDFGGYQKILPTTTFYLYVAIAPNTGIPNFLDNLKTFKIGDGLEMDIVPNEYGLYVDQEAHELLGFIADFPDGYDLLTVFLNIPNKVVIRENAWIGKEERVSFVDKEIGPEFGILQPYSCKIQAEAVLDEIVPDQGLETSYYTIKAIGYSEQGSMITENTTSPFGNISNESINGDFYRLNHLVLISQEYRESQGSEASEELSVYLIQFEASAMKPAGSVGSLDGVQAVVSFGNIYFNVECIDAGKQSPYINMAGINIPITKEQFHSIQDGDLVDFKILIEQQQEEDLDPNTGANALS